MKYKCEHKKEIERLIADARSKKHGALLVSDGTSQQYWRLRGECCCYPEKPNNKWWQFLKKI